MVFTDEEMKLIATHLPTIERIIVNHSCSNLSIAFRQDMQKLADKFKLKFCTTCSSSIMNLVSRFYRIYNEQKLKENGRKKRNSGQKG